MLVFLFGLAALWAIGIVAGTVLFLNYMRADSGPVVAGVLTAIGLPTALVIAAMPALFIMSENSPTLAVLKKNEWVCSETRTENFMMPVVSGSSTTMVPSTRSVCVVYTRTH